MMQTKERRGGIKKKSFPASLPALGERKGREETRKKEWSRRPPVINERVGKSSAGVISSRKGKIGGKGGKGSKKESPLLPYITK